MGACSRIARPSFRRRPRGYYHEYTVETPGSPDRGRTATGHRRSRGALLHGRPLRLVPVRGRPADGGRDDAPETRPGRPPTAKSCLDRRRRRAPGARRMERASRGRCRPWSTSSRCWRRSVPGSRFPDWVGRNWDALSDALARPVVVGARCTWSGVDRRRRRTHGGWIGSRVGDPVRCPAGGLRSMGTDPDAPWGRGTGSCAGLSLG